MNQQELPHTTITKITKISKNGAPLNNVDFTRLLPPELWNEIFLVLFRSVEGNAVDEGLAYKCANSVNRYVRFSTLDSRRTMLIKMNNSSMDSASKKGQIDLLDWWLYRSGISSYHLFPSYYSVKAVGFAAEYNRIDVLDWWRKSCLPLQYNNYALEKATENGHAEVLHWWKANNLKFHYVRSPLDIAKEKGHWEVIEWWIRSSGQPLVFKSSPKEFERRNLFGVVGY